MAIGHRFLACLRIGLAFIFWMPWFIAGIVILSTLSSKDCPCEIDGNSEFVTSGFVLHSMWYPTYCRAGYGMRRPCESQECIMRYCNQMMKASFFTRSSVMNVHGPNEGDALTCEFVGEWVHALRNFAIFLFCLVELVAVLTSVPLYRLGSPTALRSKGQALAYFVGRLDLIASFFSIWVAIGSLWMGISMGRACTMWDWKEDYCQKATLTPFKDSLYEHGACEGRNILLAAFVLLLFTSAILCYTGMSAIRLVMHLVASSPSDRNPGDRQRGLHSPVREA
jgi:hypothetical protein